MTTKESLDSLKSRLDALKSKKAISDNRYLAAQTILKHTENFIGMESPPGLEFDLLVDQGLKSAENLIKVAEAKSS